MLERLQTLFLGDGVSEVKFRWLVFYGITVAGFAFVPLQKLPHRVSTRLPLALVYTS